MRQRPVEGPARRLHEPRLVRDQAGGEQWPGGARVVHVRRIVVLEAAPAAVVVLLVGQLELRFSAL